ncbi:hypothetical protein [Pedobacter roseus]|uniref:Uncharacterized protein n=1 Tax=Pedobacter roseus TaxID=336820 RepID=A0A7G9QI71_9SPHI|nr:hypothetical protein [Pedobacter roseus]QNN43046.1 hypothetical protein H9L23_02765 [Pedobacter roseus]
MKFLLSVSILILGSFFNLSFAQTTGKGCNIGDNVATIYLGQSTYYGNSNVIVQVYSNANIVNIARGQGWAGYRCGSINVYDALTKNNVSYPAVNEVIRDYKDIPANRCVAVTSYSADITSATGEGFELDYSYNNPAYYSNSDPNYPCNAPTNNLPLDQSIIFMLLPLGFFGFWKVRQVVL